MDREKRRCISDRSCHRFRVDRHEREEQCQNPFEYYYFKL